MKTEEIKVKTVDQLDDETRELFMEEARKELLRREEDDEEIFLNGLKAAKNLD